MASMKENAIRNYIASIDFKRDDWRLPEIKENLRKFLGEEPGIDISYKKDVILNEFKGEAEEIRAVQKITILFSENLDNQLKKLEFLID
jgi:hypothetical protein